MMPRKHRRFSFSPAVLIGVVSVVFIFLYAGITVFPLATGPRMTLNEPVTTEHGVVRIAGTTRRVSKVTVNDLDIPISEDGTFTVERSYPTGYTVVVVRALDRFGRVREETLAFTINEQSYGAQEESLIENDGSSGEE